MNRIDRNAGELARALALCCLCLAPCVSDRSLAAADTASGAAPDPAQTASTPAEAAAEPTAVDAAAGEPTGATGGTTSGSDAASPPSPAAQRHLEAVRAIEDEDGAYAPGLPQQLLGLGLAYQQEGRHAEAVETLNRAAHISRVNEGLYNAGDIPILEHLIESYAALGDWEHVDNRYQQVFRIHHRNYGEHDARLFEIEPAAQHALRAFDRLLGSPVS